jgi:dihydroflavonol-4-reductase
VTTLVTGGAGFLGSRLTRLLCAGGGDTVRALDLPRARWDRIDGAGAEVVHGDITDRASVARAMEGVTRVFHVAALYELGTPDPARMRAINVGGTANVLEEAHARGALAVHVSSVAALGPTASDLCDESHWSKGPPRSAYEATKREAHELARRLATRGARVRIGLPATIYGAGDPSLVGAAHKWLARGLLRVGVKESMHMPFVHVDDCAEGLVRIAERGKDGEEYILCADVVTFRAWFEAFARASGRRPPRAYVPDRVVRAFGKLAARVPSDAAPLRLLREATAMADGAEWAFTGAKARRDLGWTPRPFAEGLHDVARWCAAEA